ncbi:hypothetical protein V6N12_063909 [Hibiscus sabdariffa]|uniref:CRIB domain-containing protein n=1 Tax=Hibiscus sabdariffa TaxID=183260 RepID=A0ABR2ARL3_9ROSI
MEIGQPTDVIHVSHIGGDHFSTISPRWKHAGIITKSTFHYYFGTGTDDQSIRSEPRMKKLRNRSCTDLSNATEKRKRRRKSTSTSESSSTKSRRLSKTKTTSTQLDSSSDYEI